jgi:PQQ-dependent dehydrogenase (methanol/ethanol family)
MHDAVTRNCRAAGASHAPPAAAPDPENSSTVVRRVAIATSPTGLLALLSALVTACNTNERAEVASFPQLVRHTTSVATTSPPAIANDAPDDGEWTRAAKDFSSSRFSQLDEITVANVSRLKEAWSFSTGVVRGHEAAPIVAAGMMYVVTPFPNIVYGFDLSAPGSPPKWTFRPEPRPAAQGVACCDVVNRGAAFADGKLVFNTLDGQTIAVDAATGRELWRAQLGDINKGETITMAPLIVKSRVLVGNSGGELGVRGWLTALDLANGAVVWKAWHTGPDSDVLIGPRFKPFYAMDQGRDLGVTTWPGEAWKIGGGGMWGWISYDPALDLVYYGTANPGPWNGEQRPGDNKWTAALFARDPDTGEAVFAYQWSPHDVHDYDGVNEQILLDATIGGRPRKLLVRPERNGYMYLLDRETGEVLSADAFGLVNSSTGVDLTTGRLMYDSTKIPITGEVVREICPGSPGMKDWQPSAYSPRTGLLYVPHQTLCQDSESVEANYIMGTPYVGANVKMYAAPNTGGSRGELLAWDVVGRKPVWAIREDLPVWSGALATAGDVVFYGTMDGWFKAVNARSGETLWRHKTESGIIGQPITYRGPDGKQYVAVLSGIGGWAGAIVSAGLDPRDSSAALGFVNAVRDLPAKTVPGGKLHVFALPGPPASRAPHGTGARRHRDGVAHGRAAQSDARVRGSQQPAVFERAWRGLRESSRAPSRRRPRCARAVRVVDAATRLRAQHAERGTLRCGDGCADELRSRTPNQPLLPLHVRVRHAARPAPDHQLVRRPAPSLAQDRRADDR